MGIWGSGYREKKEKKKKKQKQKLSYISHPSLFVHLKNLCKFHLM